MREQELVDLLDRLAEEYEAEYKKAIDRAAELIWWSIKHHNGEPYWQMFNRYER